MDKSGCNWMKVDAGRCRWTQIDICRWMKVDVSGLMWLNMDENICGATSISDVF